MSKIQQHHEQHHEVDEITLLWDHPTMVAKTDAKKRVVLPGARPGDVFDVQNCGEGRILLVKLERPSPRQRMTRKQSLKAMAASPLRQCMSWEELRSTTRDS